MGIIADTLGLEPAVNPNTPGAGATLGDLAGRGLRSGALGARGQLNTLAGTAMDAFAPGLGAGRHAAGAEDQAAAQEAAQGLVPFGDVQDVSSGLRWASGAIGQSTPVSAAAILGGLATGGAGLVPAALGGAAAMLPFEAGDQLQRQRADPVASGMSAGEQLGAAALPAAGASLVQSIVPAGVAGRLAGRAGGRTLGQIGMRAAADVPAEGLAEGAGEGIRQFGLNQVNPDAGYDQQAIIDNAIQGAALGGALGTVGAAGEIAHKYAGAVKAAPGQALDAAKGLMPDSLKQRAGEALGTAKGAVDQAVDAVQTKVAEADIPTQLRDLYATGKDKVDTLLNKVADGTETADPSALDAAGDDVAAQSKVFEEADKTTLQRTQQWVAELADEHLTPEKAAQLKQYAATIGEKASQQGIAVMKRGQEAVKGMRAAAAKFYERMAPKIEAVVAGVKKSADTSGAQAKIGQAITGVLGGDHPALQDAQTLQKLADGLRPFIERVGSGKALDSFDKLTDVVALYDVLGEQTTPVLKAVHDAIGSPTKDEAAFYGTLNQMDAINKGRQGVVETMQKNLVPELQNAVRVTELKAEAEVLGKWARSKTDDPGGAEKAKFQDAQIRTALAVRYGDKADLVLKAVEKTMKAESNMLAASGRTEADLAGDESTAEPSNPLDSGTREVDPETEAVRTTYYPQKDQLYLSPELDKGGTKKDGSKFDGAAAQRIKTAQRQNPHAVVAFKKASEIGLNDPRVKAKYAELLEAADVIGEIEGRVVSKAEAKAYADKRIEEFGLVVAEASKQETQISSAELEGLKLDAKKFGASPARLDAGEGVILDAVKMTEFMHTKLKGAREFSAEGDSGRARSTRAFKEAVAAVQDNLGRAFDIPDSTQITRGAKPLTWGEARKLSVRTDADKAYDAKTTELERQRANYKNATPTEKENLKRMAKETLGKREEAKAREQTRETSDTSGDGDLSNFGGDVHGGLTLNKVRMREIEAELLALDNVTAKGRAKEAELMEEFGRLSIDRKLSTQVYGTDLGSGASEVDPFGPTHDALRGRADDGGEIRTNADGSARGDTVMGRRAPATSVEGAPPDPKAVAAKRAAFEKRARSGDAGLLKTLASSTDAKGLQRAVIHLNSLKDVRDSGIANTVEAINARLTELVRARPELAYTLQTKKYSFESDVLHASLGRPGFGATHDSPTKHDGRFDWRTHAMTGEGAMVKGAGTYLSTSDGVHKYYKAAFTGDTALRMNDVLDAELSLARKESPNDAAAIREGVQENIRESLHELDDGHRDTYYEALRLLAKMTDAQLIGENSPTYHVSVDIAPEQLMDWDKRVDDQPTPVQRAMESLAKANKIDLANFLGEDFYRELSQALGGDRQASEAMQAEGILGHRMKAATKDGDVNPNYVIYDDSKIHTNYVNFDATKTDPTNMGPQDRASAEAHVEKVLGPKVAVYWTDILHAGEFERTATGDVIRMSIHALSPQTVAYHESLHGLFARLRDDGKSDITAILEKAGSSAPMLNQLKTLLAGKPEALAQLTDPEERAAYMYQFWAAGKLNIGPKVETVFQRIAKFIREVTGLWTNDEKAEKILAYFHSGEYQAYAADPNAVSQVLADSRLGPALAAAKRFTAPLRELGATLMSAGGERLRDTGIPALRELANAMKLKTTSEGTDPGYLPAARAEHSRFMNQFAADMKPYTKEAIAEATEAMQNGVKAASTAARTVQMMVYKRLDEQLSYMQAAGVRVDELGLGAKQGAPYFPRSWDASYISGHQRQWLAMTEKYVLNGKWKGDPRTTMQKLMVTDGAEFNVEVDKPGMQHAKQRSLGFISHADAAPFMRKDLFQIMNNYAQQSSRRAEWARRFEDDGSGVARLIDKAKAQGATPAQIDAAHKFVRAVDGTLGDTLNPTARRVMGDMLVYQNIRLLPLAIFSSIVDPQGLIVRGGSAGDAFRAFKRGMRETVKNFSGDARAQTDAATELAEAIGTVDNAMLIHTMGSSFTQGMVGDRTRSWNDAFFRFNLMDQWNRSMRVGATEAAMGFLVKHATKPGPHSVRFLKELGLTAADVQIGADGRPKILESDGLTLEQSAKMKAAVNRWVDGAVLRPDAVDKPLWMSDPWWSVVAHLKQFVFSFHETILKRMVHEAKAGNYTPAMALASYVPVMIAADAAKGLIQGGGEEPPWRAGWTAGDHVWHGVQRAGLFGVNQFGVDAMTDVQRGGGGLGALTGPTIQQLVDAAQVLGGREQFGNFAVKSMPANALYGSALKGDDGPEDP